MSKLNSMNLEKMKCIFLLMMTVFVLSSCSEDDNTTQEFEDWQTKNETAFIDTLSYAKQQIANGSNEWKVLLNWSLQNQTPNVDGNGTAFSLTYKNTDYIVVHVLENGSGTTSPMYTDSVKVSYRGRFLSSKSYPDGYVFDSTFDGKYDKETARVMSATINSGFVDGFVTALLNMHVGDHWMVYIPCQLAYGTSDYTASSSSTTIPGYSMLRFEIVLRSYYHPDGSAPTARVAVKPTSIERWVEE